MRALAVALVVYEEDECLDRQLASAAKRKNNAEVMPNLWRPPKSRSWPCLCARDGAMEEDRDLNTMEYLCTVAVFAFCSSCCPLLRVQVRCDANPFLDAGAERVGITSGFHFCPFTVDRPGACFRVPTKRSETALCLGAKKYRNYPSQSLQLIPRVNATMYLYYCGRVAPQDKRVSVSAKHFRLYDTSFVFANSELNVDVYPSLASLMMLICGFFRRQDDMVIGTRRARYVTGRIAKVIVKALRCSDMS